MHQRVRLSSLFELLATLICLAPLGRAGDYDLEVVAQTDSDLTAITEVEIDDAGTVIFLGADGNGSGVFRAVPGASAIRITSPTPGSYAGLGLRGDAPSYVVTVHEMTTGDSIERWNVAGGGMSILGSSPGDFDSAIGTPGLSVSSAGNLAFWAETGGNEKLLVGPGPFVEAYSAPLGVALFIQPAISDDDQVVFRDNSGHVQRYRLSTGVTTPVTAAPAFFALSGRPAIASDGSLVVFTGNRGQGAGILGWTDPAVPGHLHLAGEGLEGLAPGSAPVLHDLEVVVDRSGARGVHACLLGSNGGVTGIHAAHWTMRTGSLGAEYVSGGWPRPALPYGTSVGSSTVSFVISACRMSASGAFVANAILADGSHVVVKATPRETVSGETLKARVSVKRVLGPAMLPNALWTDANVLQLIRGVNRILRDRCYAGFELVLDGGVSGIVDVPDPSTTLGGRSWFTVPNGVALNTYEILAEANPVATGWDPTAINVYLIDGYADGTCGECSFPPTHPCNSPNQEIVFISPVACGAASALDGTIVTLAHELGHYFGLAHTHNTACVVGPDAPAGCAFPFYDGLAPIPGDLIRDTPYDPHPASLAADYGACPATRELVQQNLMGYWVSSSALAGLTAGQIEAWRATALLFRTHVLIP